MNNDLISRSEAIEIIRSMTISLGGKEIFHPEAKKSVVGALDEIHAIDAEPVRLRVEKGDIVELTGWYRKRFYCPCGQLIRTEAWDEKRCFGHSTILKENVTPNYCPNCGAKVDTEVDGDD